MVRGKTILVIGFVIMCFNSLYQYAWNALLPLFKSGFGVSLVEVELAFSLFTVFSTTFQIVGGSIADYRGPRLIGVISSLLSGIGFLGTSFSSSIYEFYTFWSLGSIGEGILYGIAANLAVKWFPSKRGFATGFVSLGFGLGSAIANPFIASSSSFRAPTLVIGLVEIVILPLLLYAIDYPKKVKGDRPTTVIRTVTWWLIYVSFSTSAVPLTVLSSSLSVLSPKDLLVLLVTVFPLLSGASRPIIGYLSDSFGRVGTTSAVLFAMIIGSTFFLLGLIVPSVVIIGFFGGSMITLFFALSGDIFGEKYSTANNAILYTGKALAGVLGSTVFSLLFLYNPLYAKVFVLANAVGGFILIVSVLLLSKRGKSSVGVH
ncbi:MFS transporter [Stygiolobus caldivivus]|uniref:Oxalate/formate antiport family MFS transporter n=1 Tax=Stygiolobus caldivivus TaxID=2824673 RepID=A0A8D5U5P5_9CREN|nr:MFS transporter [Stygiolobus caldivivus]BCU69351.1 oxalate/formate antiport family MFS transporter [Stygiolobus caldivivus]